jgi:hypothetical protein
MGIDAALGLAWRAAGFLATAVLFALGALAVFIVARDKW